MFRLGSASSGAAGSQFPSVKLLNALAGVLTAAIVLRISYPVTVSTATFTSVPSAAQIVNAALGNFIMRYGKQGQFTPYSGVSGGELLTVHQGVLRSAAPTNITGTSYAVGNYTLNVDVIIPFFAPALTDGRSRLPGWSQTRTMELNMTEGAALNLTSGGTMARQAGANVTVDIDVLGYSPKGVKDQWSSLLSYYKQNQSDYKAYGPAGLHYLAWEASAAYAATAIQLFSVFVGAQDVARAIPPYIADDRYQQLYLEGEAGAIDAATQGLSGNTVVFSPDARMRTRDLPHGQLVLNQPQLYVATLQLRGLYWPDLSQDESEHAAEVMSQTAQSAILLHVGEDAAHAPDGAAASLPLIASPSTSDDFTLKPGLIVSQPGATPKLSVPTHITEIATAQVRAAGASGAATQQAAKNKVMAGLARQIPGYHSMLAQGTPGSAFGNLAKMLGI
ncbi:MAG: hypothetical protein ACYCWW_00140 [Deltaproteobacteria bacterium]